MLVRDRMHTEFATILPEADYKNALKIMEEHALHQVPVLDAAGQLTGIVAERDLLFAATHYLHSTIEISELMHRNVVTVLPDTPIGEAAKLMAAHHIGGLPVIDDHRHVVGMITKSDIFQAFVEITH